MDYERLIQFFPVAVDHSIAQVDAIAGQANDALYHIEARRHGGEKHHDIVMANFTIGKQRAHPPRSRRELDAIHKYVIADEQGVLHRAGWNLKSLQDEGN